MKSALIFVVICIGVEALFIIESNILAFLSFLPHRRRLTRDIGGLLSTSYVDDAVQENCGSFSSQLEVAKRNMNNCVKMKRIPLTPRDEYIENLKSCSNETRAILKTCLPEKLRYLPELIYGLSESLVEFVYDDYDEIESLLVPCFPQLGTNTSREGYRQCALKSGGSSDKIPGSKKTFCEKFILISGCFVKQVNAACIVNPSLEKLMTDYMNAMEKPCK